MIILISITSFSLMGLVKSLVGVFIMVNLILGITGASGSGKSYLANLIHNKFYPNCVIINQDNYYLPQDHLNPKERKKLNFDAPSMIDWDLTNTHLSLLKASSPVEIPQYSFKTHTRLKRKKLIQPKKLIIFEGIFALYPKIILILSYKVFLDTNINICFQRRLDRDINERGRTKESVINQYKATVEPGFKKYILPSKKFADLIITNGNFLPLFEVLEDHMTSETPSP